MKCVCRGARQDYLGTFQFQQQRMGFLYGTFEEDGGVVVHAIYEPPQNCTAESFELLDDPRADQVERLATMLNLKRVGWIYFHPPREEGFFCSGDEIIFAAMEQLESAQGVEKTPFVTMRCTVQASEEQAAGYENVTDALQVSVQCMEMVAEGALEPDPTRRDYCAVNPTFTAIMEGKEAKAVQNSFFLKTVAIKPLETPKLQCQFPQANRMTGQTRDELKDVISSVQGGNLSKSLADFHLLLFLMDFQDMFNWETDMPRIAGAVLDEATPLDEGYEMILKGFAGIDMGF